MLILFVLVTEEGRKKKGGGNLGLDMFPFFSGQTEIKELQKHRDFNPSSNGKLRWSSNFGGN